MMKYLNKNYRDFSFFNGLCLHATLLLKAKVENFRICENGFNLTLSYVNLFKSNSEFSSKVFISKLEFALKRKSKLEFPFKL